MFRQVPYLQILPRWLLPGLVVFYLGIVAQGLLIQLAAPETRAAFRPAPIKGFENPQVEVEPEAASPLGFAWQHWSLLRQYTFHPPEVCWGDNAINDFQKSQCAEFWQRFRYGWLVGLIPLLSFAMFLWSAQRSVARVYRQARERLKSGKAESKATVTSPPGAPLDVFAWLYGLRPIAVEVRGVGPKKSAAHLGPPAVTPSSSASPTAPSTADAAEQRKLYLPSDQSFPEAGQVFAVYAPLQALGSARYIGTRYTPHVVVRSS